MQAEIASSGTADSFIKATHVTKTRHDHEVTAACLYALIRRAYSDYSTSVVSNQNEADEEVALCFQEWCSMQANKCVHFDYWMKTLSLELLLLVFIQSIREGNFDMYVKSLAEIVTWFFALDHRHYSRWLSVHIRDMMMLSEKQLGVLAEFKTGKFVICKTSNKFSAMEIDQCHEQNNALVKGSEGAIGQTENSGALRRWTVAEPEIVRITKEFEGDRGHSVTANQQHHD